MFNSLKNVALKAYNKADQKLNFAAIAAKVDAKLTNDLTAAQMEKLENIYEAFMTGANKVMVKIDTSKLTNIPMSTLKVAPGTYELAGDLKTHNGDAYYRGYGVDATLKESMAGIRIKLYHDCLWGDVNHDGKVNAKDATLILQYSVGLNPEKMVCTLRADVNGDHRILDNGDISGVNAKDATLILQHSVGTISKFPVEK